MNTVRRRYGLLRAYRSRQTVSAASTIYWATTFRSLRPSIESLAKHAKEAPRHGIKTVALAGAVEGLSRSTQSSLPLSNRGVLGRSRDFLSTTRASKRHGAIDNESVPPTNFCIRDATAPRALNRRGQDNGQSRRRNCDH